MNRWSERAESLGLALLGLPWLALAVLVRIVHAPGGVVRDTGVVLRRWAARSIRGWVDLETAWWASYTLEPRSNLRHHLLLLEFFDLVNLACGPRRPLGPAVPQRYLVVRLAHLGDVLHIGPYLAQLTGDQPDAEVDLLLGPWSAWMPARLPPVRRVWLYNPHFELFNRGSRDRLRGMVAEAAFLWRLRRARYEVFVSTSTLNLPEYLLTRAVAARVWVGAEEPRLHYLAPGESRTEAYDSRQYEADRVCALARHLGRPVRQGPLQLRLLPEEVAAAGAQLAREGLGDQPFAVIAPGAGWSGKIWRPERFAAVADHLLRCYGLRVCLLGTAAENSLAGALVAACRVAKPVNLCGKTPPAVAAAILQRSALWVGNDSGLLHVAACFETPCVVLFGPTVVSKWAPRHAAARVVRADHDCRGCISWHPRAACKQNGACMDSIPVSAVLAAVDQLLAAVARPIGQ